MEIGGSPPASNQPIEYGHSATSTNWAFLACFASDLATPIGFGSTTSSIPLGMAGSRQRIGRKLRDDEGDAALDGIDFEDPHVDFLGHGQDLPGINTTLGLR